MTELLDIALAFALIGAGVGIFLIGASLVIEAIRK
jgi:hypothetical protein